ncbi:MAG: hypothetical protein LUD03_05560 [Firmicutes bacterium]|nr:hypothetical protein [Bacillota bacterium]
MKSTSELINNIKSTVSIQKFLSENEEDLYNPQLKSHLQRLLKEKNLNKMQVIRRGALSENYAYQIFSGVKLPSRDKVIQLAVGFGLNLEETSYLLKIAGVGELYPRTRHDAILIYCIEHKLTIMQINDLMYDLGEYIFQ